MFKDKPDKSHVTADHCCQSCGRKFRLEIHHHTTGKFGLLGGVLYGQDMNQLTATCEACYNKDPEL